MSVVEGSYLTEVGGLFRTCREISSASFRRRMGSCGFPRARECLQVDVSFLQGQKTYEDGRNSQDLAH